MGLNDVGLTLAGIAAPTASGFVTLSGSLSPSNASLVLNGVVAYVNASGAFLVSVVPGTYAVSVSAYGYFPFGEELPVLANTEVHFALVAEAAATSTRTEGTITATGYNVTITGLASAVGSISVDFTADSAGRLLVVVPYLAVQNVTIGEFLASRVYVDGTAYTNFTITLNSSYVVTLSVFGLSGDPALLWALSPAVGPGAPTSSPTFLGLTGDLGYYLLGGAVAVTVAAAVGVLLARRGRSPPAPPPADPGASGSSGEAIAAADDSLGDVLTPWYARPAARPAGK